MIVLLLLTVSFLIYASFYYTAGETALRSMQSDQTVLVTETAYGWHFDGPSEEEALIFYPGAKVEETAYAPMLHLLAAEGMDVCLLKVPLHFAFFSPNAAEKAMEAHDYEKWYIGGHSLGGVVAAWYASDHEEDLSGTILFASYPIRKLPDSRIEILLFGSEDQVINRKRMESSRSYASEQYFEHLIEGGNHGQFGDYGMQRGDGTATISAEEQIRQTVSDILKDIR